MVKNKVKYFKLNIYKKKLYNIEGKHFYFYFVKSIYIFLYIKKMNIKIDFF